MSAITAERPYVVPSTRLAEDALWDWVKETAEGRLRRPFRREMARLRYQGRYDRGAEHLRTPDPADEPVRPPGSPSLVVLHLESRAWQPDQYDWRVVARPCADDLPVTENYQGTRADELPARLAAALGTAFRMCDEPDNPAILQVVVDPTLVDLEVEQWQLPPTAARSGCSGPSSSAARTSAPPRPTTSSRSTRRAGNASTPARCGPRSSTATTGCGYPCP